MNTYFFIQIQNKIYPVVKIIKREVSLSIQLVALFKAKRGILNF